MNDSSIGFRAGHGWGLLTATEVGGPRVSGTRDLHEIPKSLEMMCVFVFFSGGIMPILMGYPISKGCFLICVDGLVFCVFVWGMMMISLY